MPRAGVAYIVFPLPANTTNNPKEKIIRVGIASEIRPPGWIVNHFPRCRPDLDETYSGQNRGAELDPIRTHGPMGVPILLFSASFRPFGTPPCMESVSPHRGVHKSGLDGPFRGNSAAGRNLGDFGARRANPKLSGASRFGRPDSGVCAP